MKSCKRRPRPNAPWQQPFLDRLDLQREVLLVEDTSGKGHLSKSVGGKMRRSIFVPIE